MAALSILTPSHISDLITNTILSASHHRLSFPLSSSTLFSVTLHHLHTLYLPQKTLLIACHLFSSLHHLTRPIISSLLPLQSPPLSTAIGQLELDALLLLILFRDTHKHNIEALEAPYSEWRVNICKLHSHTLLNFSCCCLALSIVGACVGTILIPYIEMVGRLRNMVDTLAR
ncbi:hypothetical protein RIF29_16117 [Crotalaria pallida]|uniref:Uncharacterized protein n=1 Tax=Crotalaria pallida TaxID=3830 RepID=A0AAN9FIA8_CROPI